MIDKKKMEEILHGYKYLPVGEISTIDIIEKLQMLSDNDEKEEFLDYILEKHYYQGGEDAKEMAKPILWRQEKFKKLFPIFDTERLFQRMCDIFEYELKNSKVEEK